MIRAFFVGERVAFLVQREVDDRRRPTQRRGDRAAGEVVDLVVPPNGMSRCV
jgi:hypothetical protein